MRELQYRWHCVSALQTAFCTVHFKFLFKNQKTIDCMVGSGLLKVSSRTGHNANEISVLMQMQK